MTELRDQSRVTAERKTRVSQSQSEPGASAGHRVTHSHSEFDCRCHGSLIMGKSHVTPAVRHKKCILHMSAFWLLAIFSFVSSQAPRCILKIETNFHRICDRDVGLERVRFKIGLQQR